MVTNRCGRHRPPSGGAIDFRIETAHDAVLATMLSLDHESPPTVVLLFCDGGGTVRMAIPVEGAWPGQAARALEVIAPALADTACELVAVGLVVRGDEPHLSRDALAQLVRLPLICDDYRLELLEVVVVAGLRWESVLATIAGGRAWEEE